MTMAVLDSPVFLGLALSALAAEFLWRRRHGLGYDGAAFAATLGVAIGQVPFKLIGAGLVTGTLLGAYRLAPVQWALDDWRTWVIGFLAVEFTYYWQHRMSHQVRWFWATHSVHHTPNELVLPAALRLGWTGGITGVWLPFVPLAVLGLHPLVIATLLVVNLRYQLFLHTEAVGRLGPVEWLFNTPSHHRVHHASNPEYLDKNFGGVLIIFDRLFGTFATEHPGRTLRYGLTEPLRTNNPFAIAFHEWRRMISDLRSARSIREILAQLFARPRGPSRRSLDNKYITT